MVQTQTNWLSNDNSGEQIDTNTFLESDNNNILVLVDDTSSSPNADYDAPTSVLVPTLYQSDERRESLGSLDLSEINEIYETGDFARLHPHLQNGSLVVLPKEQLADFMSQMRDNMILINGLNTLAQIIQPLINESEEGKAMVSFLAKNANLLSGKEIGMVEGLQLLTNIPTIIRHFKAMMGKIDLNLLKDNADFAKEFKAVLGRNNSPFLTTIHRLGDGLSQLKP